VRSKNINPDGSGNGPDSDFINRVLGRLNELQFYSSGTVKVEQLTRGTRFRIKPSFGGSITGLQFQQPYIELDPTIAISQWTIVNVSPNNPIATTGIVDLVSNVLTVAPTGYWVAVADIPAQTSTPKYNVPVMPPTVAWVSSPGSQKGDLDQAGILWLPLPRIGTCV
jgi:hypothetical protein